MKTLSKLLLGLILLTPAFDVLFAADVVFSFNSSAVTVVEEDRVFQFPVRVFVSQFGFKMSGDVVNIPKHYDGFLVSGHKTTIFSMDAPMVVRDIQYGGIEYHSYYERVFNAELDGRTYSWSIWEALNSNTQTVSRSPSSVDKIALLKGVTDDVVSQKVGNEIRYFDKKNKLLWVAKL